MSPHTSLLKALLVASVVYVSGCRTTQEEPSEMDGLLRSVSYDASIPIETMPDVGPNPIRRVPLDSNTDVAEKVASVRRALGKGFRATAGFMLRALGNTILSMLGLHDEDDEDDLSTPRGRADANFNQWIENRDKWRRDH